MFRSEPPRLLGAGLGPLGATSSSVSGTLSCLRPQKDVSTRVRWGEDDRRSMFLGDANHRDDDEVDPSFAADMV